MKKPEFYDALDEAIPAPSPIFTATVRTTLADLSQAERMRTENLPAPTGEKGSVHKRRVLSIVLAAAMIVAAVAVAATLLARNVFDVTMGDTPVNASSLTQYDLAKETVGNAEIAVREAAYDGMSLYIAYSIRDLTATALLGTPDDTGERRLRQEDYERIEKLGVGWWWDNLWIDGKNVNMPSMSGGENLPGELPGEAIYYMQYRLDQENLFLDGKSVEIALPIGQRQDMEAMSRTEDGILAKPAKGMVTFTLDCSRRDQAISETPGVLMEGPRWSAKVSKVVYSPIQMYVTLDWAVKPEVLEAYIAENGDGYYKNGVKLHSYDGLDACGSEMMNLKLVDKDGKPVFESMQGFFYGCTGANAEQAWYSFPYAERYPEAMFLAPMIGGEVDMTQAIKLK